MAKIVVSGSRHFISILKPLIGAGHEVATMHQNLTQHLRNLDLEAASLIDMANKSGEVRNKTLYKAAEINAKVFKKRYVGNSVLPAVKKAMNKEYAGIVYNDLADMILFIHCLDEYQPDIILLHNDVEQLNRAAAFWAKAHNVPCLHIPHAIYQNIENKIDIHRIVTASHLASAGPYQSLWYSKCGLGSRYIFETGLPQFDDIANTELDRGLAIKGLDLQPGKPVVTYASSWRQDTNLLGMHDGVEETYLAILECAKGMPDVQFLIKTHPHAGRDNARHHLEAAQKAEAHVAVTPYHLPQVLQASDLLFAYGPSNVILEGAHIPWSRLACTSGYEQDDEVYKVMTDPPNIPQMMAAIYNILEQPPIDTFRLRNKYLGPCDGRNWERVVKLVESLLAQYERGI